MNIENAKKLIAQLKRLKDEQFWMGNWIVYPERVATDRYYDGASDSFKHIPKRHRNRGTIACIAGWVVLLNAPNDKRDRKTYSWARRWLGLGDSAANWLFSGCFAAKKAANITRLDAIAELERMVAEKQCRRPWRSRLT